MSGNFGNTSSQKYSNFQHGAHQYYKYNPVDHQEQRSYESGQPFRNEPSKGQYRDQTFKNTVPNSQGSNFPSSNWQSNQYNVMRQCDIKSQTFSEQLPHSRQQQPMQGLAASNSQVSTVSNFTRFSNPVSSQQSNLSMQTPQFYHSSNLQQPYNASRSNRLCSPLPNQQVQIQQNQGPGKVPQFLASNRFPTNLQYQSNQPPVSHVNHQTNSSSHFSDIPSNQQGNTQQTQLNHQFSSSNYQTNSAQQQSFVSSKQCSSIPDQHTRQQQYQSRPNQAPQFSLYSQMPPNIPHQPDGRSALVSQNSVGSLSTTLSHHKNVVPQQKTQLHQQSFATNQPTKFPGPQQNSSLQQIQNCQSNVFSNQTGSFWHPNSIPSGSTSVTPICNQQSSGSSDLHNQTPQIPVNSLPSNFQNSSYQTPVVQPISQVPMPVSVPGPKPNFNTGVSFGPTPASTQHHFSNYQAPGNIPNMRKTQQENTNSQFVQYCQSNTGNTQVGSAQQLGSVPPVPNCMPFIDNQHSVGQQNIQVPPSPVSNLPPNSQNNLYRPPAVTPSSQISVPLPIAASQHNVNTPCAVPLAPPSNVPFPTVQMQQYFGNYQTLGNVSETNVGATEKSQSDRDLEWVSHWLVARGKGKKTSEVKKPSVSIPEIRKLLHQATTFLKALSLIRDSMKSCKNDDNEAWENKAKQAMNIKQRLQGLLEKLLQPEVVLQLLKKLRRRKTKRVLHRKQRERRKMEKLEQQKRRLEVHRCLDSYMETEKEKVLQAKREEELKKEADIILSEVRRKLQEGKRAQERLRVIEKLRQARKETAEKRGLHISEGTDKQFIEKITQLKEMVHKQLTHYDAEEKALKVMLETEQEGQLEQEETNRKERQKKLLDKMQEEIKQCLFGGNDPLDASNPLWYFRQYYTQAENSLETLLQTRRQWDMYLVPPTNPSGSSVPVCWVTPDPPSSHSWASALSLKECE